jgi:hypothetical protein
VVAKTARISKRLSTALPHMQDWRSREATGAIRASPDLLTRF